MFIAFEGSDGSGKSTQARRLAARLAALGHVVRETREPGGTPLAEQLRTLLVTGSSDKIDPMTELLLFTAARHDHLERLIKPALARGEIVVSDRYLASTIAYQGWGGGLGEDLVWTLHRLCNGGLVPDLTIVVDLPSDVALARARARLTATGTGEDRFESKAPSFHEQLSRGFRRLAEAAPERHLLVDGSGDPGAVEALIWAGVRTRLA